MFAIAEANSNPSKRGQRLPDDRLEGLTERRPRAKRDEQVEPEHGWREDQRHSDQGFDEQLAAEMAVRGYWPNQIPNGSRTMIVPPQPQRDTGPDQSMRGYCGTAYPCFRKIARAASLRICS